MKRQLCVVGRRRYAQIMPFVNKIHANMNPKHRDRIAFLRFVESISDIVSYNVRKRMVGASEKKTETVPL